MAIVKSKTMKDAWLRVGPLRTRAEIGQMRMRLAELEEEVRECRRHHHRTAELTDIVVALLVPIARRDEEAIDTILRDYTDKLG